MPPRTGLRVVLPNVVCRAVSMNGSHRMRFPALCLTIAFLALSPTQAQCASDATEAVREAINDLLDDFDDFKDSEIFRQCVYGCGSENPGKEWRGRIKTLQRQAMPREDVPPQGRHRRTVADGPNLRPRQCPQSSRTAPAHRGCVGRVKSPPNLQ